MVYKDIKTSPFAPKLERRGEGSGCIIDKRGYIVTNNHVVENANKIEIVLSDGKMFTALNTYLDPETDLAVVQIDPAGEDLPVARLGDSDQLRVGDFVMAMGSPFGLEQTVTAGIVSFKGRQNNILLSMGGYEDFIQTDAEINKGNSGGPLVNLYGEVVGINSNIFSPNREGTSVGYGFAIPSNIVRFVAEQLIEKKQVKRGWLGVWMAGIAELKQIAGPPYQKKLFEEKYGMNPDSLLADIPDSLAGVAILKIVEDSPAQKAGMQAGDVILKVNEKLVTSAKELRNLVGLLVPGDTASCLVWRDGEETTIDVVLGDSKQGRQIVQELYPDMPSPKIERFMPDDTEPEIPSPFMQPPPRLGATIQNLTPATAVELGYPAETAGVLITSVQPGSLADENGFLPGDVILAVDGEAVTDVQQLQALVGKADFDNKGLEITVLSQDGEQTRIVKRGVI
jgi:serine protease Do